MFVNPNTPNLFKQKVEQALELRGVNDVNDVIRTCVRCILALPLVGPVLRQALLCGGEVTASRPELLHAGLGPAFPWKPHLLIGLV